MTLKKTSTAKTSKKAFFGILVISLGTAVQVAFVKCAYNLPHEIFEKLIDASIKNSGKQWGKFWENAGLEYKTMVDIIFISMVAGKSFAFFIAYLVSGTFAEAIGRKVTLILGLHFCFVGLILQGCIGFHLGQFLLPFGCFLHSFGAGLMLNVSALFVAEMLPKNKRHNLTNLNSFSLTGFIPIIMLFGVPNFTVTAELWYVLLIIPSSCIGITVAVLCMLPESPRYLCLQKSKDIRRIEHSLGFYFGSQFSSFYYIEELLREELRESPPGRGFSALKFAYKSATYQMQYAYLVFVASILETVGLSTVTTMLSVKMLTKSGDEDNLDPQIISGGVIGGFLICIPTLVFAMKIMERYGKRSLFLFGASVQIFAYLGLGVLGFVVISFKEFVPWEFRYLNLLFFGLAITSHQLGLALLPNAIKTEHLAFSSLADPAKRLGYAVGSLLELFIVIGFLPLSQYAGPGCPWFTIAIPLIAGYAYFAWKLPGNPQGVVTPTLEDLLDQYGKLLWPNSFKAERKSASAATGIGEMIKKHSSKENIQAANKRCKSLSAISGKVSSGRKKQSIAVTGLSAEGSKDAKLIEKNIHGSKSIETNVKKRIKKLRKTVSFGSDSSASESEQQRVSPKPPRAFRKSSLVPILDAGHRMEAIHARTHSVQQERTARNNKR